MSTSIWKQLKIFRSIIVFNTVDMMHYFSRSKIPSKCFLHNKMRTFDISIASVVSMRVFWHKSINIPFSAFISSTFPHAIISAFSGFAHLLFSFFGMFISKATCLTFHRFTYFSLVFFRHRISLLKCHNNLQLKEAAFSELKRTQRSVQRLLTAFYMREITAFPLAIYDYRYCSRSCKRK